MSLAYDVIYVSYGVLQKTWSQKFFSAKRERLILLPVKFQLNIRCRNTNFERVEKGCTPPINLSPPLNGWILLLLSNSVSKLNTIFKSQHYFSWWVIKKLAHELRKSYSGVGFYKNGRNDCDRLVKSDVSLILVVNLLIPNRKIWW